MITFRDLPVEVIEQIVGYLPTASSIVNLGLTCHATHTIISQDEYSIFRSFVQRAFPTIATPPIWRDAARCLTSRSRAWDRKAFVARECHPPASPADGLYQQPHTPTVGYHPNIDCYETWHGSSWSARKEVLAWGAIGRLRLRTTKDGVVSWTSSRGDQDHKQAMDILDVRLLLPEQHDNLDGESIVLRRANGEVAKVESSSKPDEITPISRYLVDSATPNCMDVSKNAHPLLAICDPESIQLFPVRSSDEFVKPSDTILAQGTAKTPQRKRVAKFLSDSTLAVASQYLQGRDQAPISIYDISPTGLSSSPLMETVGADQELSGMLGRQNANVIVPLLDNASSTSSRPTQLFLSGWTDGVTRLHDLRLPGNVVASYMDVVDDGQILSLLPIGLERFVAGGSQNGCLKTFDLRMPGARAYSYLSTRPPQVTQGIGTENAANHQEHFRYPTTDIQRDINIFLTPLINYRERRWEPLQRSLRSSRAERYRGSVYSLSSPSPSSATIYAGIANHVIQLDFTSTDDIRSGAVSIPTASSHREGRDSHVMDLSCYERPRRGRESTDPILLRKQMPLMTIENGSERGSGGESQIQRQEQQQHDESGAWKTENGWDERWRLEVYNRRGGSHGRNSNWAT
ncbi:uncharacterized protein A1O9_05686 [Exophiala aquamarina CBS 119918]|uniref:F-box domain-containing protein n=1 Tax=Exophiala aquamarina CBS 119918 TaxID=1182545 RepID=A0A072PD74_9EURO|nr:uncharacterized protein A1O9_05686 [Exophiala aquamarina CBS 119918]KEF57766.1 hypothetical protein A1O9_05686 [Exophiala aquamarina CBS 119918]